MTFYNVQPVQARVQQILYYTTIYNGTISNLRHDWRLAVGRRRGVCWCLSHFVVIEIESVRDIDAEVEMSALTKAVDQTSFNGNSSHSSFDIQTWPIFEFVMVR